VLRKRLVTVLTFNDGVLFRTKKFQPDYRYTQSFVDAWSVDEVVLLDISRSGSAHRGKFFETISEFAKRCFVPVAAGGGVRSVEDFHTLLSLGADKVIVNTGAVERPQLLSEAAEAFGAQCVMLSIDARRRDRGGYEVCTHFGTKPTGLSPTAWARRAQELGAGEVLITSIEKDGSLEGYDNALNREVAEAVDIPVLVCGGAGKWQDFVDGFVAGGASAVCTTNIYHFTETSIRSAKSYLRGAGIEVRVA
jgi:cyclase